MSGQTDYLAKSTANFITGQQPFPVSTSRFIALFTSAPSDAGTGGTEVSGGSYARVQIAGQLTASGPWTVSSSSITLSSSAPSWLTALGPNGYGINIYDISNNQQIGISSSVSGSTVNLISSANSASLGSSDNLLFSAFPAASGSIGTEPTVIPVLVSNYSSIIFPTATANWGTVIVFAIYDSITSGNMMMWDYLGSYDWLPTSVSFASPSVMRSCSHNYSIGDSVVVTTKFGGSIPSFSQSNFVGILNVASTGLTVDSFTVTNSNTAVNTSSSGDVMVRKIIQQSMPAGIIISFKATQISSGQPGLDFSIASDSQYEALSI